MDFNILSECYVQKYKNAKIQKYKYTKIQKYENTKIQKYENAKYKNTKTPPKLSNEARISYCLFEFQTH